MAKKDAFGDLGYTKASDFGKALMGATGFGSIGSEKWYPPSTINYTSLFT